MYVGLVFAVFASTALTVGLYLMKRRVERLPSLGNGWRWAAWWAFIRDPWWMAGLILQIAGYGLYVLALHAAPLSIVHTVLTGGIVLFVILAVVGLGEHLRSMEWAGVCSITVALLVLSFSLPQAPAGPSVAHGMMPFSVVLLALAGLALGVGQGAARTVGLSLASGFMLGLASVYAKGFASAPSLRAGIESVYLFLSMGTNLLGFVLLQTAFQTGRGVVVMPLFSALSNLVPIVGGILVFGESLPSHGAAAVTRPAAFALAILGGALLAGVGERSATTPASQIERASWR
ncbi:MAG: DMT family transporter [Candidatus Binatia bacterium]